MENEKSTSKLPSSLTPRIVGLLADEVAKTVVQRLPSLLPSPRRSKSKPKKVSKATEGIFLDTSAIIDGRIFDVIGLGLFHNSSFVVPESILAELKHIADSQDSVRRERGRKGLDFLDKLKKAKAVKVTVLDEEPVTNTKKAPEVDERLIRLTKKYKGMIITCDNNLEKKANIQGVTTINMNALANVLKVTAVPGEALHVKVMHTGKDQSQGVGYLDDGTMIVIEHGNSEIGKSLDVVVARVIQTATGRILFAKKL